jgi:Family of unknown function (DUF6931)
MLFFKSPAPQLTKIQAPTAAELAPKFKPQPEAQALLKPDQTPGEYLQVLEDNKHSMDGVKMLAHGMPERESVWWACQSSQQVSGKLNVADQKALTAAQNWVKNPTAENQAAAAAAAGQTDRTGPGGWAAQAAAWSKNPTTTSQVSSGSVPAAGGAPEGMAASAVAGSVLLAAGLANRPAMPEVKAPSPAMPTAPALQAQAPAVAQPQMEVPAVDRNKLSKALKPFLDIGKDVASGKNTWA